MQTRSLFHLQVVAAPGFNGLNANWSLQNTSPCINAGDSSGIYPPTDIAGNPRVVYGCIDIGAYEFKISAPTSLATGSITTTSVTLSWAASSGATSYNIQVSVNSNLSSLLVNQTGFSGTSDPITGLTAGTSYYWQVSATNAVGTSGWAATTFLTAPSTSTLVSPSNSATNVSLSPTMTWNTSAGAVSYRLQVSTLSNFSYLAYQKDSISGTTWTASISLSNYTQYYWRVGAKNAGGYSGYSDTFSFTTVNPVSGTVTDIDGNVYHTVTIGTQIWMVENLKTTRFNDGTAIPLVTDNTAWEILQHRDIAGIITIQPHMRITYGALYNWYAVNTGKLAPTGWHVPYRLRMEHTC